MLLGRLMLGLSLPLLLAVASPAAAQESGRPERDSPAGVEYQVPLERAREEASRSGDAASTSSSRPQATPLFGEGIAAGPSAGERPGSNRSGKAGSGADGSRGPGALGRQRVAAIEAASRKPDSGTPLTLALIAGIAMLGLGLGFLFRRYVANG